MSNFGYKVHLYTAVFLILVFYMCFSLFFGILVGLFLVFWYSTTPPPPDPVWTVCMERENNFIVQNNALINCLYDLTVDSKQVMVGPYNV